MTALIAVVGLRREARILAAPGLGVVVGGSRPCDLGRAVRDAAAGGARGVFSFGLAGALDPDLRPGDLVIADAVALPASTLPCHGPWRESLRRRAPWARGGTIAGVDIPVPDPAAKARLHGERGAVIVDMESGAAALAAAEAGLPFVAVRAVSDGAHRALPAAALAGFGADGTMDAAAVVRALMGSPWQIPALVRTGLEAEAGFRALRRWRRGGLGPLLGLADV